MSKKHFSVTCYFLALFSVAMAIYTVAITSVNYLSASDWGLVVKLSAPFWIGLLSLFGLIYLGRNSKNWMITAFILTVIYLYGVPTFIKENARMLGTSYPAAEGELIAINGELVSDKTHFYRYHNFPGFLYLVAIITLLAEIPLTWLCKYAPLFTITFYGLLIYIILKTKLNAPQSLIGTIWFLSSFWVSQHYFSPQGISFISFLLTFVIVTWLFLDKKNRRQSRRLTTLVFILFIFSVFSHPLTPIMTLSYLITLFVVHKTKTKPITYIMVIALLSIQFFYFLFEVYPFLRYTTLETLTGIRQLCGLQFRRVQLAGSLNHVLTNTFRISIAAINMIIVLIFISSLIIKRSKNIEKYWLSPLLGFSLLVFISAYGLSEMLTRIYMFALIPFTYICINFMGSKKPKILLTILCTLILLNIPANYGGESFEMVTNSEIVGASFYLKNVPRNASYFSLTLKSVNLMRFQEPASVKAPLYLNYLLPLNDTFVRTAVEESKFMIYSESDLNQFLYYQNIMAINASNIDKNRGRIYDNPYIQIYTKQHEEV